MRILPCDGFRLDPCIAVVMPPETHSRVVTSLDKVEGFRSLALRGAPSICHKSTSRVFRKRVCDLLFTMASTAESSLKQRFLTPLT